MLSPAGVRLCAAALVMVTRQAARRDDGAVTPTDDVAYLREVLRLAQGSRRRLRTRKYRAAVRGHLASIG
jgi:hypothetical protein